MTDEVNDILKGYTCKDMIGIIMNFSFCKCRDCEKLFYEEKTFEMYDNTFVCIFCYKKERYSKCSRCDKMFNRIFNIYCNSCCNPCKIFCPNCLSDDYKRPYDVYKYSI